MRSRTVVRAPLDSTPNDIERSRSGLRLFALWAVVFVLGFGFVSFFVLSQVLLKDGMGATTKTAIIVKKGNYVAGHARELPEETRSSKLPPTAQPKDSYASKDVQTKNKWANVLARLQKSIEHPENENCPAGDRRGAFTLENTEDSLFNRLVPDEAFNRYSPTVLSRDPWIIQFDTFFSEPECLDIINDCIYWTPDAVIGGLRNNSYRNSSSYNCDGVSSCAKRPGISLYRERMASMLGIGLEHTEGLNILKYEVGGFYGRHHDFIMRFQKPRCHENAGPRILTFMAYLTDVAEGGATSFFKLGIDVLPKAGRVVLWTDTLAKDPLEKDERTAHEALVVKNGTKIVATTWIRQFDASQNLHNGCCDG